MPWSTDPYVTSSFSALYLFHWRMPHETCEYRLVCCLGGADGLRDVVIFYETKLGTQETKCLPDPSGHMKGGKTGT